MELLIFFGAVIVVELLLIGGLIWLWFQLEKWIAVVFGARTTVHYMRSRIERRIKAGERGFNLVSDALGALNALMPWWLRGLLMGVRAFRKFTRPTG